MAVGPPNRVKGARSRARRGSTSRDRDAGDANAETNFPPPAPDPAVLVRELNHRVKNNFQIIVSLMNLRKRMLPPGRREDIRFIEEHVQSMSVAYRLVYATGSMVEVALGELTTEVVLGLRQIAGLGEEQLRIESGPDDDALIGLDHAIALALYFAVLLPPWLDEAVTRGGSVTVAIAIAGDDVTLSVRGSWRGTIDLDVLRTRLMQAYAAQLCAEIDLAPDASRLRFTVDRSARARSLA